VKHPDVSAHAATVDLRPQQEARPRGSGNRTAART
jgi:hypothetical protein